MAESMDYSSPSLVDLEVDWDAEDLELRALSPSESLSAIVLDKDREIVSFTAPSHKLISSELRVLSSWTSFLF